MSGLAFPKIPPGRMSRLQEKLARRSEEQAEIRACYKAVDERDKRRCRVCGKKGSPTATGLLERIHRHHMVYRSRGGQHEPDSVVSVCSQCHDEIHVRGTLRLEGDANARDERGKLVGVGVWRLVDGLRWDVVGWC